MLSLHFASVLYHSGQKIQVMNLQERINAVGQHAVKTGKALSPRSWKNQMADAAGCSYQNISNAASGKQMNMNADLLKRIAHWAGVDKDWMIFGKGRMLPDQDDLSGNASFTVFTYSGINYQLAPVVAWESLGELLNKDNDDWPEAELHIVATTKQTSKKVKWLEVKDDLLAPKVLIGDKVAVDPAAMPKMDGLALVRAVDGSYMLRFWRPLAGGGFEVFDSAGRTMDSIRHGLEVVGAFVCLQRESL